MSTEQSTGRDCKALVKLLTERAEQHAADMRRRFLNTIATYGKRHDVGWWPENPEQEQAGREGYFFYRPGQLLVRNSALAHVECVLSGLGVESCGRKSRDRSPVTRLVVASRIPTPALVFELRRLDVGPREVTVNHVWWPNDGDIELDGAPWWSGGAGSLPEPSKGQPDMADPYRGEGVTVAVFDSALLSDWSKHLWMSHVNPLAATDVGEPDGGTSGHDLDIYDSHGVAVAGVVAARAPQARVVLRDVLNELGDVDEWSLIDTIDTTLQNHPEINIVNLSLGGATSDNQPPLELGALIDRYPDVIFVAAAGNNGLTSLAPVWPAAFPGVIGVGALNHDGSHAAFSNDYPSADVWAPGAHVVTAFGTGTLSYPDATGTVTGPTFGGMATWSGTSFAAPYISGLLAGFALSGSQQTGSPSTGGTTRTEYALAWLRDNAPQLAQDTSHDQVEVSPELYQS